MNYGQNASTGACGSAKTDGYAGDAPCAAAPPTQTLESLIQNTVDFVGQVKSAKAHSSLLRDRLCGSRPEAVSNGKEPAINGMLDALGYFQQDARQALYELQDNLAAISAALG
jgi:hypothetical protein